MSQSSVIVGNSDMAGSVELLHQLHIMVVRGKIRWSERILDAGADIDGIGPTGVSALMLACAGLHVELVSFLLTRGASPNLGDHELQRSPLHWISAELAAGRDEEKAVAIIRLLIKAGAVLTLRDCMGKTPVEVAGLRLSDEVRRLLCGRDTLSVNGVKSSKEKERSKLNASKDVDIKKVAAWMASQQKDLVRGHIRVMTHPSCILVCSEWMRDYESVFLKAVSSLVNEETGSVCVELPLVEQLAYARGDGDKELSKSRSIRKKIVEALDAGQHVVCVALESQQLDSSITELVSLELDLPRFDGPSLANACAALFALKNLPAIPEADWIPLVGPADLVACARVPVTGMVSCLKAKVRQRVDASRPEGDIISLDKLKGLGEAKEWASSLIADVKSAREGRISWDEVDRGALLHGAPGVGKTSLARAIASDSGMRMVSTTASQWHGAGSLDDVLQAMEKDFARAAELSPCVLFIDEIDAIGSRTGGSNDGKYDQWITWTVNHLLALMDGFARNRKIVVLGATNHPEKVDPALRRSGRLDRLITIPLPNRLALESIFSHYLNGFENGICSADIGELAACSVGVSGADVERFVREARRRARKASRPMCKTDVLESIFQTPSPDCRSPMRPEEVELVAYHEAGHAVLKWLGPEGGTDIRYISIVPRADGMAGFMAHAPQDGRLSVNRTQARHHLAVLLAGRAAEQVKFGEDGVTSGGAGDLVMATESARRMVRLFGFGRSGRLAYMGDDHPGLADEVERELQEAYAASLKTLQQHGILLERVAQALIDKSELAGGEFLSIADDYARSLTERSRHELRAVA